FVVEPPVARHDDRAALSASLRDRDVEDPIERRNHPFDRAAVIRYEAREARRRNHAAGADDVRSAEEHDRIAVGVRAWHVNDLDRLAVEIDRLRLAVEG